MQYEKHEKACEPSKPSGKTRKNINAHRHGQYGSKGINLGLVLGRK